MESRETDSYGEWVIRKLQAGGDANPLPAEVLAAARVVWPRIPALVASEIKAEGSIREAEALAADIWEGVLRSVGKAIGRKGKYASSIVSVREILSFSKRTSCCQAWVAELR
jgi:hypothetical protein